MSTKYKINNPLLLSSEKSEALEDAYELFVETFLEYAEKNNLTNEEIIEFQNEIKKAYLIQKSIYLLENKVNHFTDYLNSALCKTIKNDETDYVTKIYYKRNSHLVTNE